MSFDEILAQVLELLRRERRVSYRALKRRFDIDDQYLEDLKAEIIQAKRLGRDEDGTVLVWAANGAQAESGATSSAPIEEPLASAGERRHLTVMFCDLVGSTALSERLDPEELREIMRSYQSACVKIINRFDGYVAQYLGDGLLVYFGYPGAHEDDAQRAVRAGLGIVAELKNLQAARQRSTAAASMALQAHIGIHTGLVVVGEMGAGARRESASAVGETPNLAARVQHLAEPGDVMISSATHRLVEGFFVCQDLGPRNFKGISAPVRVYRVLSESGARGRFEAAGGGNNATAPFTGRDEELHLLLRQWEQVKAGQGHVILLSGEPGIGKSRLAQQLKEQAARDGAAPLAFYCSPYHENSALYPAIQHLQRAAGFESEDSPQERVGKLTDRLGRYRFADADTRALFASLLSLSPEEDYERAAALSPQQRKQLTLEALVALITEEAERGPLLCAWEDLQWADPSTLELLGLLVERTPATRMLLVLTFRPQFTPPWLARAQASQLTLSRLGHDRVREMIHGLTGGKALPPEVFDQIVNKTDGVPLFVEELTKMVLESELLRERGGRYELAGPLPPLAIPATLHDSLMARLDRQAAVKEIAQLGAVLGREFSYELIRAVSPLDEEALRRGLHQLVEAELIYQYGMPPHANYLFKHALVQDAAYQSLLNSRKQRYHLQVAEVMETHFAQTVEARPELVAHHYTQAGLAAHAIPHWQRAGAMAARRSADAEAVNHFAIALELLQTLPDTDERARLELDLRTAYGPVVIATRGWAAPEAGTAYNRARELCERLGDTPGRFPALFGIWAFHLVRAEHKIAYTVGTELLHLAKSAGDSAPLIGAHWTVGCSLYFLGDFAAARDHLEQGAALYEHQRHGSLAFLHGHDPGVSCLCYGGASLWCLGYADQARVRWEEALALARRSQHSFSLAYALQNITIFQLLRREWPAARGLIEEGLELCAKQGFAFYSETFKFFRRISAAVEGKEPGLIDRIRRTGSAYRPIVDLNIPLTSTLFAEACGKLGSPDIGLGLLDQGLAVMARTEERYYESELRRMMGELVLRQAQAETTRGEQANPAQARAEQCFREAIEIARRQQAKALELRSVMSLCRLWQGQGRRAEARQLLAPAYGWFSEGFDTADLVEAGTMLSELT